MNLLCIGDVRMAGKDLCAAWGEILLGSAGTGEGFLGTSCLADSSEVYCGIQPQLYHFKRFTLSSVFSHFNSDGMLRKIREGCCALTQH